MTSGSRRFAMIALISGVVALVIGLLWYRPLTQTTATAGEPTVAMALQSCDLPDGLGVGRCGTLEVYENRASRAGRKIGINVIVVPATGSGPVAEPVFWFEGGPGGAATQSIGPVSRQYLAGVRNDRDLVFVDQRGTGRSNPLRCGDIGEIPANLDAYFGKLFPLEAIRACRESLAAVADLTQYTTSIAMDDLDDVRAALGYEKINLAGASYGTIAAQVYMRQHPDRVRAAFLVGIATPGFRLPLPFARATQHAWERVVSDCAAAPECGNAFPRLQEKLDGVLARFSNGPIDVRMEDPATRELRIVKLERESFVERLRGMLYTTHGARFVPHVVHRASLNDFLPFQAAATRFRLGGSSARGMYFSVTCAESIPFITEEEIGAETKDTFLGDRRVRAHIAACAEWPRAVVGPAFLQPVKSSTPVIFFSGALDGSTPPWEAERAIGSFSSGRLINAPHTGHQIDGPCTWDLMQAFFRHPSPRQLDVACAAGIQRPAFARDAQR